MSNHGHDRWAGIFRMEHDIGVSVRKHAEHLVGKSLPHRSDIAKVEDDLAKLFEVRQKPPCLGTGDIIGLQELDQDFGFLKLVIVLFWSKLAEHVFNRLPGAALDGKLHECSSRQAGLRYKHVLLRPFPFNLDTVRLQRKVVTDPRGEENPFTGMGPGMVVVLPLSSSISAASSSGSLNFDAME